MRGEVRVVLDHGSNLSIERRRLETGGDPGVRVEQRFTDLIDASARADDREVRPEEATAAADLMAFDAAALAEEQRFARGDVPLHSRLDRRRTQAANEGDEVPNLIVGERKWRHVRSGHALLDGFEQLIVVGSLDFAAVDQARAAATFAVRSVTGGAGVDELTLAGFDSLGRVVGPETDDACQRGQNPMPHRPSILSAPCRHSQGMVQWRVYDTMLMILSFRPAGPRSLRILR